jgi:hypothetical protein
MSSTKKKIAFAVAAAFVVGIGARHFAHGDEDAEIAARDPKQILGRVWFDHLPKNRSDDVTIAVFFGGGIGLYDKGSAWRSTIDVFEFERRKDVLDMTFLHDKKNSSTKFEIKSCDDKPPFDVCVTFDDAPRGPKTLYGFAYDDEMERAVPWSRDILAAEKQRAALGRARD